MEIRGYINIFISCETHSCKEGNFFSLYVGKKLKILKKNYDSQLFFLHLAHGQSNIMKQG